MSEPRRWTPTVWEVERDRFGIMFSGPLEVGEMRQVMPVEEHEMLRAAAQALVDDWDESYKPMAWRAQWDEMESLRAVLSSAGPAASEGERP